MASLDLVAVNAGEAQSPNRRVPAVNILTSIQQQLSAEGRTRELLVYVHIPFCSSKCTFCGWVTGISTAQLRSSDEIRASYVEALTRQIEYYGPQLTSLGYVPEIVYWGGGTPSILTPGQITAIGSALRRSFDLSAVREYSVESSPETLTEEKVHALENAGMNRLSIGIQSFNEAELRRAARAHSVEEAIDSVGLARAAGCRNLNIDIITGFPAQTPEFLEKTLTETLRLRPEHVTAYTYNEARGSVMARQLKRGDISSLAAEQRAAAMDITYRSLAAAGYSEYISMYYSISPDHDFAGEDWYFNWKGDHIGFGTGANSILANYSLINRRNSLELYLSDPTVCDNFERMSRSTALNDSFKLLLLLGGRLNHERFRTRYGFEFKTLWNQPRMKAFRLALNHTQNQLITTSGETYISPPAEGWHGGDLLRLSERVMSAMAEARRPSSKPPAPTS